MSPVYAVKSAVIIDVSGFVCDCLSQNVQTIKLRLDTIPFFDVIAIYHKHFLNSNNSNRICNFNFDLEANIC